MTKKDRAKLKAQLRRIAEKAIDAGGGPARIAKKIGTTRQAVHIWRRVPEDHCEVMAEITGMPKHELRPDLFRAPA